MTSADRSAKTPALKVWVELLILSVLTLFCELVIIRWLSTEIRIFAYFKNLPLLAVFLGLGLGFVRSDRKPDLYGWSAVGLLYLAGLLTVAFKLGLTYLSFVAPDQFMLWGLYTRAESVGTLIGTIRSLAIMVAVFALSGSIFVGLGQRMGRLFSQMKPLSAYSINVLGGLLGSLLMLALSFMNSSPGVWMVVAGAMFFLVDRRLVSAALVVFGIAYMAFLLPMFTQQTYSGAALETLWSPYYRIDVVREKAPLANSSVQLGYNVYINYDSFQSIVDCSPPTLARLPKQVQGSMLDICAEPFRLLRKPKQQVLVLGSGSGSDVSAALRNGIGRDGGHIDAVEIDPCIAELGKTVHPEHPYQAASVSLYVTDARNYLQNCKEKYDVIVFAALDSHAAFSSLSSLRMDNYVFTEESFRKAASLLSPDGIIFVNFVVPGDWLWDRHCKALSRATNSVPIGYRTHGQLNGGTLIAGPGVAIHNVAGRLSSHKLTSVEPNSPIELSTDDWPFIFLPRREVSSLYVLPLLLMLGLSALPISLELARGSRDSSNWQMFFLGMAFMLLEVRAMADLSLLFGSTWIINSVIISAVMVVILIANWLANRINDKFIPWLLAGVLTTLLLSTTVSASNLLRLGPLVGGLCGITMYLLPLVFASTVFALLFKKTTQAGGALAFNLIGGGVGVCLEYLSMWTGIRALGWIGALLYLVVLAIHIASRRETLSD